VTHGIPQQSFRKNCSARRTRDASGVPAAKSGRAEGRSSIRQIDFRVAIRFGIAGIEDPSSMAPSS
jgi:hypothetical protein